MKKYIAEFIGTFTLVLFGTGIAVISGGNIIATAMTFGLAIIASAYVIGNISGCHVNPAVSLAMFISRKLSLKDFIYIYYQNKKYIYEIVDIYEIEKNGTMVLKKNKNETMLTLITCSMSDNKKQIVITSYLKQID